MANHFVIKGNQLFDEYILVAPGSDYGRVMWSDIEKLPNGRILESAIVPCGKILELLHHIHFSFLINKKIQMPFQAIWKKWYSLENIQLKKSKKYCVIYTDVSAARTDRRYLAELKRRKNIELVLVMVNIMARRGSLITKREKYFSKIFSFDKKDCDSYGFIYHPTNYSKQDVKTNKISADAFFIGVSKGRTPVINKVYDHLVSHGVKSEFFISGIERGERRLKGIRYDQWLNYRQILNKIGRSNCIVEIMDGEQEGYTLRTMEAVCYNRKLLTNNKAVINSKYYQSGYIQVFDDPKKIDTEFLKKFENVNYNYEGEFSPVHLLEHINQVESESKK